MDRKKLKYTLLAIADHIFSTSSTDALESALERFCAGDSVTLSPYCPADLDEYEAMVQKMSRALAYKPRHFVKPKPKPEQKPSDYPNLFTMTVPMEMDVSKLSDLERQVLYQNLDKMLLVTMHPPLKRTKECAKMRAKIGIPVRHLWPEQKQALGIKEDSIPTTSVEFYKEDVFTLSMIFIPMLHHFYKVLSTRINLFGVPP